ncbi:hypothetical protein LPJ61_006884, partial [Coemansia biformis]
MTPLGRRRRRAWCAALLLLALGATALVAWRAREQRAAHAVPLVRFSADGPPPRKYRGALTTPPFALVDGPEPRDPEGCLLFVARTSSLTKVRRTMFDLEHRFNRRFRYPYVFLGERAFSPAFQAAVRHAASGHVQFGRIDDWWEGAGGDGDGSSSTGFRRMARFWAAPFAAHPALAGCRFVWRLEPGSQHTCDVEQDPLALMRSANLSYAFAVAYAAQSAPAAAALRPLLAHALNSTHRNSLGWLLDAGRPGAATGCQLLTSSELVDLRFVRSREYQALFRAVDRSGGFGSGWSDASLRSLAVAALLDQRR